MCRPMSFDPKAVSICGTVSPPFLDVGGDRAGDSHLGPAQSSVRMPHDPQGGAQTHPAEDRATRQPLWRALVQGLLGRGDFHTVLVQTENTVFDYKRI